MMIPMLFNTEMVQAIQAGRKTQTRRLVKEIPLHAPYFELCDGTPYACDMYGEWHPAERFCRIQPGDILWVRETWCENKNPNSQNFGGYEYRADYDGTMCQDLITWKPSIHMPKDAARIFLRVKDVRAERLWDISEADCLAEGIMGFTKDGKITKFSTQSGDMPSVPWQDMPENPVHAFWDLWNSTIKSADRNRYGWLENPWVWVVEFERCEKPEGWCA